MAWVIVVPKRVVKRIDNLPKKIQLLFELLMDDIEELSPIRGDWPNFGKLSQTLFHCHLKKGKPAFVAVWKLKDRNTVEVTYAGTHENAPY